MGLHQAIKEKCRMHGFLSGGGLRVVRIEKGGQLKGYGEHPDVSIALLHADQDFLAGGKPYDQVYGAVQPHYLTGSKQPTGPLDAWLLKGRSFTARRCADQIVFQLDGYGYANVPQSILDEVLHSGRSARWKYRGFVYDITRGTLPSGKPCTCSRVVKDPEHKVASAGSVMYPIVKTGYGKDLMEAMKNAFRAREVEVAR